MSSAILHTHLVDNMRSFGTRYSEAAKQDTTFHFPVLHTYSRILVHTRGSGEPRESVPRRSRRAGQRFTAAHDGSPEWPPSLFPLLVPPFLPFWGDRLPLHDLYLLIVPLLTRG